MRERSAGTQPRQAACSRAGLLAVAAAVLALVAACSGGSHPAGSSASSSPNLAAMNSYARCLRTHGLAKVHVTRAPSASNLNTVLIFDGLAIEGVTRGSPQVRTAVQACHHLLPQGTRDPGRAGTGEETISPARALRTALLGWRALRHA